MDPTRHLALARAVARRFWRRGLDWDDLEQAARLGLVEASRRFEPQRGVRFSTFAVPYIAGAVRRWLQVNRRPSGAVGSAGGPSDRPAGGGDEERLAVRLALEQLPQNLRRVVELRFYRGLSQQETALQLGLSQPTVSRRERLALRLLRGALADPEGADQHRGQLPEGAVAPPPKGGCG